MTTKIFGTKATLPERRYSLLVNGGSTDEELVFQVERSYDSRSRKRHLLTLLNYEQDRLTSNNLMDPDFKPKSLGWNLDQA